MQTFQKPKNTHAHTHTPNRNKERRAESSAFGALASIASPRRAQPSKSKSAKHAPMDASVGQAAVTSNATRKRPGLCGVNKVLARHRDQAGTGLCGNRSWLPAFCVCCACSALCVCCGCCCLLPPLRCKDPSQGLFQSFITAVFFASQRDREREREMGRER